MVQRFCCSFRRFRHNRHSLDTNLYRILNRLLFSMMIALEYLHPLCMVHKKLNSAWVSVYFQETIDMDDVTHQAVPGSDFIIAHEAFRDKYSSKYYINGHDSTSTAVTKKLKGKGVDFDNNRFLILQGEVEQIPLMKPKGLGKDSEHQESIDGA